MTTMSNPDSDHVLGIRGCSIPPDSNAVCAHADGSVTQQRVPLRFCQECPVTANCIEVALMHDDRWGLDPP